MAFAGCLSAPGPMFAVAVVVADCHVGRIGFVMAAQAVVAIRILDIVAVRRDTFDTDSLPDTH